MYSESKLDKFLEIVLVCMVVCMVAILIIFSIMVIFDKGINGPSYVVESRIVDMMYVQKVCRGYFCESEKWMIVVNIGEYIKSIDVPASVYYSKKIGQLIDITCNKAGILGNIENCYIQ